MKKEEIKDIILKAHEMYVDLLKTAALNSDSELMDYYQGACAAADDIALDLLGYGSPELKDFRANISVILRN